MDMDAREDGYPGGILFFKDGIKVRTFIFSMYTCDCYPGVSVVEKNLEDKISLWIDLEDK